jgi:hypothetical protein
MGKFQMIKPYPCDKIYESSNIKKCSKKFYEILKQDNEKYDFFILKNMDNNDYYKFQINNNKNIQMGGVVEKKVDSIHVEQNLETKNLIDRIEKIESRVAVLENKKESSKIVTSEKKNDDNSEGGNLSDKPKPKRGLITPPEKEENICIIM